MPGTSGKGGWSVREVGVDRVNVSALSSDCLSRPICLLIGAWPPATPFFRSSIDWVIRRWRDCCIRSTLFMHSTALLARNISSKTTAMRP